MLGAVTKAWWAETQRIDPASVAGVSVMPCTAKKSEAERPEMATGGHRDVDHVLTTRELVRWLKAAGVRLLDLPEGGPTPMLSEQTGAAPLFGTTGGVLEAALRTGSTCVRQQRAAGLYATDAAMPRRRSHENTEVAVLRRALADDGIPAAHPRHLSTARTQFRRSG